MNTIRTHLEHIVSDQISGHAHSNETSRWIAGLSDRLSKKLVNVGLVKPRDDSTLIGFVDSYIESRKNAKESTIIVYNHTPRRRERNQRK